MLRVGWVEVAGSLPGNGDVQREMLMPRDAIFVTVVVLLWGDPTEIRILVVAT